MKFSTIRSFDLNPAALNGVGDIEKSSYSEIFGYSKSLKIKKSGKDIKVALEDLKSKEESRKTMLYERMSDLIQDCPLQPTEKMSSYVGEGVFEKISTVPKLFKYEDLYDDQGTQHITSIVAEPVDESKKATRKKMQEYNEAAREYVRKCCDIIKLETTINNLEDKAKYELSVNQAALLGF